MKVTVIREPVVHIANAEAFTPGRMYVNGLPFAHVCEDEDRRLESEGIEVKVYGRTAIPRGTYPMTVTFSQRFQKELPYIAGVDGFEGVRVHGGNRAEHSSGCLLIGQIPTASGVAQCAVVVQRLIAMIKSAAAKRELCWLEVK